MYKDKFPEILPEWQDREIWSNGATVEVGAGYPSDKPGALQVEMWRSRTGQPFLIGTATGRAVRFAGQLYLQFVGNIGQDGYGYVKTKDVNPAAGNIVARRSDKSAQTLINRIIHNNKIVLENNLLCAEIIRLLDNKGVAVPMSARENLARLQYRLENRNNRLLNSKWLNAKKQAYPPALSKYAGSLDRFMRDPFNEGLKPATQAQRRPTIGAPVAVPLLAVIIVSVLVTALVGWIIYRIFKPDYNDSKADLQLSEELTALLANVDPEVRQRILTDLEGQIDKAYLQGKMDGSGSGMLKTIGYAGAGLLGFMLLSALFANTSKTNYYNKATKALTQ